MKILKPIPPVIGTFSRASTGTYYDSTGTLQTAAVNIRRFTYDPTNLTTPPVEMREPAATNYAPWSEDISQATYFPLGSSSTLNAVTAPDGTLTADKLVESTSTGIHGIITNAVETGLLPVPGRQVVSVYAKAAGRNYLTLGQSSIFGSALAYFDLVKGVMTFKDATVVSTSIVSVGNGWFRCAVVFDTPATIPSASAVVCAIYAANSPTAYSYTGNGASGIYVWGVQYEQGAVATSYIKTTTGAVLRAADVSTSGLLSNVTENVQSFDPTRLNAAGDIVRWEDGKAIPSLYQALKGKSISNATIALAGGANVTWVAHGLLSGDRVMFPPSAALPSAFVANKALYVAQVTNTDQFTVSNTSGGTALDGTDGTGAPVTAISMPANALVADPSASPTVWLNTGATNRWAMFDGNVQSQTVNPAVIDVSVNFKGYMNTLALLNIVASSVRIRMLDSKGNVVYDNTKTLASRAGITNWYNYFFNPIRLPVDLIIEDLPTYSNGTILVTISVKSGNAACGAMLFGFPRDISLLKLGAEKGAKIGIQDYSVKTQDAFGNYTIVPRAFSKRADFTVYVGNSEVDDIENLLASYRSTPVLYIGSSKYAATILYGYYKTFDIDISYDDFSACSIQIEGLT